MSLETWNDHPIDNRLQLVKGVNCVYTKFGWRELFCLLSSTVFMQHFRVAICFLLCRKDVRQGWLHSLDSSGSRSPRTTTEVGNRSGQQCDVIPGPRFLMVTILHGDLVFFIWTETPTVIQNMDLSKNGGPGYPQISCFIIMSLLSWSEAPKDMSYFCRA